MKIYFKGAEKTKNIADLIKFGFSNGSGLFVRTYKDPKYKDLQCNSANRSFLNFYWMCKTYFPKTTKQKLTKTLFKIHKQIRLNVGFCTTIQKIIFNKSNTTYLQLGVYNESNQKGVGRYSFLDIKKLTKKD